jgi:hypothetical protein
MVEIKGSSSFSVRLPDSCSLTRSINASVELLDGLLDLEGSGGMIMVDSNSVAGALSTLSGTAAGASAGLSSGELAMAGMGAEPSDAVGGL